MEILLILLGVIVSLNIFGFAVNTIFFKNELKAIKPYGQMVDVNGKKMHVYSVGNGEQTVVLLPGMGVPLPSADFGPLMRKLSENYTVVTVEYFGVGFSEETKTPRTTENYVNEVRAALDKAGFKPPYILMPHSISGVYCEYYAARFPEEVSSMIMLDTTSTAVTGGKVPPVRLLYSIGKLQQATGLTRLAFSLVPDPKRLENGYTPKEKADYKLFYYHVLNDTLINQTEASFASMMEVKELPFPKNIPVLKLIASQTIAAMAKKDKDDGMGYQKAHLSRLGESAAYKVIEGSHFIYHTKADEIAALTHEFTTRASAE